MKALKDIQWHFDLQPTKICSYAKYFKQLNIDWDVYLSTKNKNLQRGFVWTLQQKRELIWSILLGRPIPPCSIINCIDKFDETKDIYLIIDGKQRLSSIFDFIDDKFTIEIEDKEYLFSELPVDYRNEIDKHTIEYYIINEPWNNRITDDFKISWFAFLNFAGTPQDSEHLHNLLL